MKVWYKGNKEQIWISFPLTALGKKNVVEAIQFIKYEPVEVKDEWAKDLLSRDPNFEEVIETRLPKSAIVPKKATKARVKVTVHPRKDPYGAEFEAEIEKKLGASV